MLASMLFNVVAGLIVDKAQDLAKEHVEDILPDDAKDELDKIIKDDPTHTFDNAKDALVGAVEGKLPISLKDGTVKPIELNFKVKFDPNTMDLEIEKS